MKATSIARASAAVMGVVLLTATASAQNTHIVRVGPNNMHVFEPADLIVCEGDTVIWNWEHGIHNVRELNLAFNSGGPVTPPATFTVVFDSNFVANNPSPGNLYDYVCDPHWGAGMVGTITVVSPRFLSASATAGATGTISVTGGTPGNSLLLGYSLAGAGPTPTQYGTLALSGPFVQLPAQTFDASGDVNMVVNVPASAAGATVHLHGLELFGNGTGVLVRPATIVVL